MLLYFLLLLIYRTSSFFSGRYACKLMRRSRVLISDKMNDAGSEELGFQQEGFKSGFVSILGNPNVGKSTLMNALLNQTLCIVSPKPQTTRHRILGVITEQDYQIVFSDTPGLVLPAYRLQEAMMESVRGAASDADVVLLVTDVYGEPLVDEKIMSKLQVTDRPIIIAINKGDLLPNIAASGTSSEASLPSSAKLSSTKLRGGKFDGRNTTPFPAKGLKGRLLEKRAQRVNGDGFTQEQEDKHDVYYEKETKSYSDTVKPDLDSSPKSIESLLKIWANRLPKAEIISISAMHQIGLDALIARLLSHMKEGPKYFPSDQLTNRDERFFAAEIVREAVFNTYKNEIPYSCEVVIEVFKDKTPTLSVIEATIVVNRSSQKAIIIGKGGDKLKELGIAARKKLELFLGRGVFLSLHVRVDEDWRIKQESLQKYGYESSDFG